MKKLIIITLVAFSTTSCYKQRSCSCYLIENGTKTLLTSVTYTTNKFGIKLGCDATEDDLKGGGNLAGENVVCETH